MQNLSLIFTFFGLALRSLSVFAYVAFTHEKSQPTYLEEKLAALPPAL